MQGGRTRAVVVTGASTGIGKEISQTLVQNGFFVFGSVRKEADGQKLRAELGDQFAPLLFDVTNQEKVLEASQKVRFLPTHRQLTKWQKILGSSSRRWYRSNPCR